MRIKSGSLFYLRAFMIVVLATHLLMCVDSGFQHVYACTVQNAIGVLVTATLLLLSIKNHNPFLLLFLLIVHLEGQVFTGIVLIGWGLQFQFYYLGIMVFSVFMSFSPDTNKLSFKQKFLAISAPVLFFTSYFVTRIFPPFYELNEETVQKVSFINYVVVFVSLAFLANLFRFNALRFAYMMKRKSFKDELTTLYNRRGIRNEMDRAVDALNNKRIPYSIAILDIDDFKKVNDTYGHDMGDVVLKEISRILQEAENEIVTACRWGGEEFLIIRHDSIYRDSMANLARKISQKISQLTFTCGSNSFKVTVTCGCANSEMDLSLGEVIKLADNRLYHGKKTGKNKVVNDDL